MNEITLDILMLRDKYYFEQHPNVEEYIREYVPGEFLCRIYPTPLYIRVIKLSENLRIRQSLNQLPNTIITKENV